jgi:hypothetical protein
MAYLNRTLFCAGFEKRLGETDEDLLDRIERAWAVANLAMGVFAVEGESEKPAQSETES